MIMHFTTHPELNHKPLTPTGVGAPDLTDIEITPAMIEAGEEVLLSTLGGIDAHWEPRDLAKRVFEAMVRLAA